MMRDLHPRSSWDWRWAAVMTPCGWASSSGTAKVLSSGIILRSVCMRVQRVSAGNSSPAAVVTMSS
eukprot:474663-Lingulodinium_polyedra.AAC.1